MVGGVAQSQSPTPLDLVRLPRPRNPGTSAQKLPETSLPTFLRDVFIKNTGFEEYSHHRKGTSADISNKLVHWGGQGDIYWDPFLLPGILKSWNWGSTSLTCPQDFLLLFRKHCSFCHRPGFALGPRSTKADQTVPSPRDADKFALGQVLGVTNPQSTR